jgi:hypothetical protein
LELVAVIDLAMEMQHLARADRDIAEGERRIADQGALIDRMRNERIVGVAEAEALLGQLKATLETWRNHRDSILSTIDFIKTGVFSSPAVSNPSY